MDFWDAAGVLGLVVTVITAGVYGVSWFKKGAKKRRRERQSELESTCPHVQLGDVIGTTTTVIELALVFPLTGELTCTLCGREFSTAEYKTIVQGWQKELTELRGVEQWRERMDAAREMKSSLDEEG